MIGKLYLAYGLFVLGLLSAAEFRGWSFDSVSQRRDVPRSVRDNPGSYRSVYGGYHHYTGGK
jgi:hypothetical protein